MTDQLHRAFQPGCTHSPCAPCPWAVGCLHGHIPCLAEADREQSEVHERRDDLLRALRHQDLAAPVFAIGTGTCGLGAGAGKTLHAMRAWLQERGVEARLVEVGCIGLCSAEPLVEVRLPGRARVLFGGIKENRVDLLMAAALEQGDLTSPALTQVVAGQVMEDGARPWDGIPTLDDHPFFALQTRRVLAGCGLVDPDSLGSCLAWGGYQGLTRALTSHTPAEVCSMVEESGLRGRGGGGFPTGRKWRMAREQDAPRRYLICNADEGDPGAFMDRALVEGDPHRLLEGMAIAAYAIGASRAYVYIRAEYPLAIRRLRRAIEEARAFGLLGHDILQSGFSLDIEIRMGAGAFVCGEETALMHSIEGERGMPRPRPPYPSTRGLFGHPTVINNVESLANVPEVLRGGAEAYAAVGTATSKGTKVFALSGKVARTGLVEVAMGTSLRSIVMEVGGGVPGGRAFKAVQIGGPSGGCIPGQHLDIQVDYESLKEVGAMMGSGGLVVMDEDTCMVDVARYFMDFIQKESCGKCIPCREGTRRMLETLTALTRGRGSEGGHEALERFKGVMALEPLARVIQDTSLCGLGQSAPNPVLSTLRWFRDEYEEHVFQRRCRAGACAGLRTWVIDPELCKGCTLCLKVCPTEAIVGHRKAPHYIVADKCVGCGACADKCKFEAIHCL